MADRDLNKLIRTAKSISGTDPTPDDLRMLAFDGDQMAFAIERQRVQTGMTFSAEAFDGMMRSVASFVGTRMIRHWDETGEPPVRMAVLTTVAINGPAEHGAPTMPDPPDYLGQERVPMRVHPDTRQKLRDLLSNDPRLRGIGYTDFLNAAIAGFERGQWSP